MDHCDAVALELRRTRSDQRQQYGLFELAIASSFTQNRKVSLGPGINQYKQTRSLDSLPARFQARRKAPSQMERIRKSSFFRCFVIPA